MMTGNRERLMSLVAKDVGLISEGGGIVPFPSPT